MGEVAEVSGARLYSCSLKAAIVAIGNCRMALQISTHQSPDETFSRYHQIRSAATVSDASLGEGLVSIVGHRFFLFGTFSHGTDPPL